MALFAPQKEDNYVQNKQMMLRNGGVWLPNKGAWCLLSKCI